MDFNKLKDPTYLEASVIPLRYKYITKLNTDLRRRYYHEYLTLLRETHQPLKLGQTWPKKGDVVQIHDENSRLKWKLGIVTELYPGPDNAIRVAQLRTSSGETTRPIVKLYPLELSIDQSSSLVNSNAKGSTSDNAFRSSSLSRSAALESAHKSKQVLDYEQG